ncbi:MAG: hypothetical protein JXJ17_06010 [Anaerolineae bacterium]|nr:hypothetical protein [Anaerolineae bacterium]
MSQENTHHTEHPKSRYQHLLAALALIAVGLVVFTLVDYGNNLGIDDWMHYYRAATTGTLRFANRPLSFVLMQVFQPIFKAHPFPWYVLALTIRISSAFLLYLLVWLIEPERPGFAFTCGALSLVFAIEDHFPLLTLMYGPGSNLSLIATLLALVVHTAATKVEKGRRHIILLIASLLLEVIAAFVREASLPLLLGIPVIVFLSQRDFNRRRWITLALWVIVVLGASLVYVLPMLGIGGSTYGSGLVADFSPRRMIGATVAQVCFPYKKLLLLDFSQVRETLFPAALALLTMILGLRLVEDGTESQLSRTDFLRFGAWAGGGLIAAVLGFAAFLPTVEARSTFRTHFIALPGEAVLLASLIWLIGLAFTDQRWRRAVRGIVLAVVTIYGVAMTGSQQKLITNHYRGTWENTANFMRSLAHLAPDVEEGTLFIYVENTALPEAPFTSGFSFQFAVRTFYGDRATAIVPNDNTLGRWEVTADGIDYDETWADEHVYGWDDLIVITREDSGRLVIVETLPDEFATPNRQAQYDPYGRIRSGYVNESIRETFPIVEW